MLTALSRSWLDATRFMTDACLLLTSHMKCACAGQEALEMYSMLIHTVDHVEAI